MAIPLSREVQVNPLVYRWFLEDRCASAKANIPVAAGPVLVTGARVGVLLPRHPGVAAWARSRTQADRRSTARGRPRALHADEIAWRATKRSDACRAAAFNSETAPNGHGFRAWRCPLMADNVEKVPFG